MDTALSSIMIALNANDGLPQRVQLLPFGTLKTRDHRPDFFLDEKAAESVLASIARLGMDLPIDYDHHIDVASDDSKKPAAGWITNLTAEKDGIYGDVTWTKKGGRAVKDKEYRYLSPVFYYDKKSRHITTLLRAALTNDPALYLKALTHRNKTSLETETMDKFIIALCKALGIDVPKDVKDAEKLLVEQVTALATQQKESAAAADTLKAICKKLNLAEDADADAIKAALAAAQASNADAEAGNDSDDGVDPTKFVPISEHKALATRLNAVEDNLATNSATALVDQAIKDGKVTPANRDWAMAFCKKDPEEFQKFCGNQPKIVGGNAIVPAAGNGDPSLTPDEKAICKNLGLSEEAFIAQRKQDAERNV